ncbi:MAG TPA: PA2779 family protein [Burkholderiales bacterium]|nr:PA2779 family protein [Burkholderiales bacterium]
MNDRLRVSRFLASSLFGFALSCSTAYAELVSTDEAAASVEPANQDADREKLRAFMARPEVVEKLKAMGVSPDEAKARVAAMGDKEVHLIAGKLDMLPAGGRLTNNDLLLITVIILAVVLLIIVL